MSGQKSQQSLHNLSQAVRRLGEALKEPSNNPLAIDGTIQRFEFVIELFWKTFKILLADEGIEVNTPREALRQAYQVKWFEDEETWLQMLNDRNKTSHIYDETTAKRIYDHIKSCFPELQRTLAFLLDRFK